MKTSFPFLRNKAFPCSGSLILPVCLFFLSAAPVSAADGENIAFAVEVDKVVSAGLCADQMVIPLVERSRIVGISPQAVDPLLSPVAEEARDLPVVSPSAEALILTGAKTVVMDSYGDDRTRALLEKLGVQVVRVPYDEKLSDVAQSIRSFGKTLDAEEQAERLAADFTDTMERVRRDQAATSPTLAAYIRFDGGSAGMGTYVDEAMTSAGYENLAARLGWNGWGRLDLETLILHPPDAFVTSFFSSDQTMTRQTFGRHSVFRSLPASRAVIQVPGNLWSCGGWPIAKAAAYMAANQPSQKRKEP